MTKYYIAYGSNLNKSMMALRCPTAKVIGNGFLYEYSLVFRDYLTVEPDISGQVPVTVWEIDSKCERALDIYEGYPSVYYKEHELVEVDGVRYDAFIYIMNVDAIKYSMPSPYYLQIVLEGYDDMDLDPDYIKQALQKTMKLIE